MQLCRSTSRVRSGEGAKGKPRVAFTFDDGWIDNAERAAPIARRYRIPLSIFVCPSKVGARLPFWPERVAALLTLVRSSEGAIRRAETLVGARVGSRVACIPDLRRRDAIESWVEWLKHRPKAEREEIILELLASTGVNNDTGGDGTTDSTMTWAQVQLLRQAGVVFGSHTQSHELLTRIPLAEAQREVVDAKQEVESRLGAPVRSSPIPMGIGRCR